MVWAGAGGDVPPPGPNLKALRNAERGTTEAEDGGVDYPQPQPGGHA